MLTIASRGVWETTPRGRELSEADIEPLWREYFGGATVPTREEATESGCRKRGAEADEEVADSDDWKELLLEQMLEMSPAGFERLAQRLLRAAGFINTTVTGQSGDGGIEKSDGLRT